MANIAGKSFDVENTEVLGEDKLVERAQLLNVKFDVKNAEVLEVDKHVERAQLLNVSFDVESAKYSKWINMLRGQSFSM